jgi:hypothetical protein
MRILWIAVLLCAGAVFVLALAPPGAIPQDHTYAPHAVVSPLNSSVDGVVNSLMPRQDVTETEIKTAIFSKNVAPGTKYIVVSLYSGDTTDPISVTIITPDKTLGPYYDTSDGVADGRIDLKISNPESMTPGLWKFLVHSRKTISYGSLNNLSWIRTGTK